MFSPLRSNNSWMHNVQRLIEGPERCTLLIHPDDPRVRGIESNLIARVTSRIASVELPVEISDEMVPGVVSIPHGYGHGRSGVGWNLASQHPGVSINDLTDELRFDPISYNAAFCGLIVRVSSR